MLIPKKNRKLIYEHLFKEGVLVAKKDFNAPKHDEVDVPNLQVIKAMQVSVCVHVTVCVCVKLEMNTLSCVSTCVSKWLWRGK